MFNGSVSIYNDKIVKYLWLFVRRWTDSHLLFFQIHEKLHYYEKQSPVPILHGAAALADDVSVPFLRSLGHVSHQPGCSRTHPSTDRCTWKPEVANVSKIPVITELTLILCWFSLTFLFWNFACRYLLVLPW